MANTFVTLKEIARQALPVLHQNLLFPNIIYTDYAQDFHGVGDTVKVRKPVIYEAGDFNEASGVQWQDIVEDSVEVTLDHIATVDARASAIETATCIDDLNRVFVEPAAIAIAEKINSDGLNLYKDVFRRVGTAGQTPSKLSDIAAARKALNLAQAPTTGRCAVWDVDADANFMSLDALVNAEKAGSNQALREGSIGRIYGMDNYMSQAVKKHETGITSAAGVKVNGAVAAGSTHVYELHGSVHRNHCPRCGRFFTMEELLALPGDVPHCPADGTVLKPDVVLYEEPLDDQVVRSALRAIAAADTMVIVGTSLVVYPAAAYVRYFQGEHLVLINKTPTPMDSEAELALYDDVVRVVQQLQAVENT